MKVRINRRRSASVGTVSFGVVGVRKSASAASIASRWVGVAI